jgi:hypothetical protein
MIAVIVGTLPATTGMVLYQLKPQNKSYEAMHETAKDTT